MKAIIIAAGMGTRLEHITKDKPKCMIDIAGKPLLQRHIEAFHRHNITDITVIKGYKEDCVNLSGVKYYINKNYSKNNILLSLFNAKNELDSDVVISYCDIFYEDSILASLLTNNADIALVVDSKWQNNYIGRSKHPISEAESVVFDSNLKVTKIGKIIDHPKDQCPGEFIGMLKLSTQGCQIFKTSFEQYQKKYHGKPFQKAAIFDQAYLTDFIQELIDNDHEVFCHLIENNWHEIDTLEDYQKLTKNYSQQPQRV